MLTFCFASRRGEPRLLARGCRKPRVAFAAHAARKQLPASFAHVCGDTLRLKILYHGARRHLDYKVFARLSAHILLFAHVAVLRDILLLILKIHQRAHAFVHLKHDRAAVTAVAAVRAACSDILFLAE